MASQVVNFTVPLDQAFGYGIVVGLGFAFAFLMMATTWALKRYQNEIQTSEMFSTAGRSVRSGLVAAAVVSSWTWPATLLQSSTVAYEYGVAGPFYYAAGAGVQIILFATIAIELKRRAPNAHTFLEALRARYGPITHCVFIVFCLMTNILVTANILTGCSAVISALTGMHTVAVCYLLPIGVVLYTVFGGIKATFVTDYLHTIAVVTIIFIFAFNQYAVGDKGKLGSPGKVYDLLTTAAKVHPIEGNSQGSYLTLRSHEGGIFFVINLIGNFGTVFLDNGYYNKAIAASPVHAFPGALTSVLCVLFAAAMASFATGLYYAGIGMGYLYLLMGVIISSAVIPGALSLLWKQQNWIAAAASPPLGLSVALIAWLVTTKSLYGELTVTSTGEIYPMLAGNVAALLSPVVFSAILTYVFGPQNYNYESMRAIRKVDDSDFADAAHVDLELIPGEITSPSSEDMTAEEERKLARAAIYARLLTVFLAFAYLIVWPMPMYGTGYVFSKRFFTGWVVVGIIWLFITSFGVIIYPLYEGRDSIAHVVRQMFLDITGRRKPGKAVFYNHGTDVHDQSSSTGAATPTEKFGEKS
ncbi:hypothetical protein VTN96DRAFT_3519 [Rasamsonia emersonii]